MEHEDHNFLQPPIPSSVVHLGGCQKFIVDQEDLKSVEVPKACMTSPRSSIFDLLSFLGPDLGKLKFAILECIGQPYFMDFSCRRCLCP